MNVGDRPVLFLEGEQLIGAKQNRTRNTSVLIAVHTKSTIPMSCVEAERRGYTASPAESAKMCVVVACLVV